MNRFTKRRSGFCRLDSFFYNTDNWGGSLLSVPHAEMIKQETEMAKKKRLGRKKEWPEKETRTDFRFPIRVRWNRMWDIWEGLSRAECHRGPRWIRRRWNETRGAALASLSTQLISTGCWRLAERRRTPGGLASESCCSTSTQASDLDSQLTSAAACSDVTTFILFQFLL